jgi:hypothetical protein
MKEFRQLLAEDRQQLLKGFMDLIKSNSQSTEPVQSAPTVTPAVQSVKTNKAKPTPVAAMPAPVSYEFPPDFAQSASISLSTPLLPPHLFNPDQVIRDKKGYHLKTCSQCLQQFGQHWQKHWRDMHPGMEPEELKNSGPNTEIQGMRDKYGYRIKTCSICNKQFGSTWSNHWKK